MSISRETRINLKGGRRLGTSGRLALLFSLAIGGSLLGISRASAWFGTIGGQLAGAVPSLSGSLSKQLRPSLTPTSPSADQEQDPEGNGSLSLPAQTCTVNCTATVPATAQPNVEVLFQTMVETSGCTATPSFRWNFGDGTAVNTSQNPSHAYSVPGTYQWSLTTSVASGANAIETIAGGLGEGNPARQATFQEIPQLARDPQGRGVFLVDSTSEFYLLRFINTTSSPVTLAGVTIQPGTIRAVAGGGLSIEDNIPANTADLAVVTGLAVNQAGTLVYLINSADGLLRVINISAQSVSIDGTPLAAGQIRTVVSNIGQGANGLAIHPSTGDVLFADATSGVNRVFRVGAGGALTTVVGNSAPTQPADTFLAGAATAIPLLIPRAVRFDSSGNLFVADTGHGRVIRVDGSGNATLVHQFPIGVQVINAYPSGLVHFGGSVYSANGNQQTITRLSPSAGATVVAGQSGVACDYSVTNCGDGGPAAQAGFYLLNSASVIPLASIDADASGIYIADQGTTRRGRVRYLNLSGTTVTLAGVSIPAGAVETIGGSGLVFPYDGGLATSSTLSSPVGVTSDQNGNLWITDTLSSLLRFVNLGNAPVTIFAGTSSAQVVQPGRITTVNRELTGGQANGPVGQASLIDPQGLFATSQGLFVVDSRGGVAVPPGTPSARRSSNIRFINTGSTSVTFYPSSPSPIIVPPGNIARIAGGGESAKGDGGFALNAVLIGASDIVVASNGTIFITDVGQSSVRRINPSTGIISSLSIPESQYTGLGLDSTGRLYIADYLGNAVLRETAAGSGTFATLASNLTKARDVAVGTDGTAYATLSPPARSAGDHRIVQITSAGVVTTIAGGTPGFTGDGGLAANAQIRISPSELVVGTGTANQLPQTVNIVVGQGGEILFTDSNNNRIRRLKSSEVLCERTGTITIAGSTPSPALTSLTPNSALQNSGSLTLTLNGSNFVPGSIVRWNGQDRPTTYVSSMILQAAIPSTDLVTAGTVSVTVFNPAPGGGISTPVNFTVVVPNPLPQLTALSPLSVPQNSASFTLTLTGTGFVSGSQVRWGSAMRPTTLVSSTQLTALIPASDLVQAGIVAVTVFNPEPVGGLSNPLSFLVEPTTPTLTAINRLRLGVGGDSAMVTVTGTGFDSVTVVRVNGNDRPTMFVSGTELKATLASEDLAVKGTITVTAVNQGVASNGLTVEVIDRVTSVLATSYARGAVAPGSILSAFAPRLANGVEINTVLPLPRVLIGTRIEVEDSLGDKRDQEFFFVAPGQANFHLDEDTAPGPAFVTVYIGQEVVAVGDLQVERISPGLFTQNASGEGVPAGYALRFRDGDLTFVPILEFNANTFRWVPIDIDMGPEGDLIILVLFGSGIRGVQGEVTAKLVKGETEFPLQVGYAGVAPGFIGLDQMNLIVPRSAIGAEEVTLVVDVEGKRLNAGNTMVIRILTPPQ
jgi:uncharacterized protein (TIGR03437 family)